MSAISDAFAKQPTAKPGVQKTPELGRIIGLPRRKLDLEAGTVDGIPLLDLNSLYVTNPGKCEKFPRCPVCVSGSAGLWPTQTAMLMEAERAWGLFAAEGVGSGKTLVTILLGDVFGAKKVVLLVPSSLKNQLMTRDFFDYGRHFKLPLDRISVVSYDELSVATGAFVLDRIEPDVIIADEVHSLARIASARTKRFIRYMQAHPETRFCGLSGTVTRRSLRDYCLAPGTRVMTADLRWVPVEDVKVGEELVGFDESLGRGKLKPSFVEGVAHLTQRRLKITTTRGTVVCSDLHGWVRCARKHEKLFSTDPFADSTSIKMPRNVTRTHRGERSDRSPFIATVVVKGVEYRGQPRDTAEQAAADAAKLRAQYNPRLYDENGDARARGAWRETRHWALAKDLKVGEEIAYYVEPWEHDTSHGGGYMAGLLDGEGWVSTSAGGRGHVGFGQKDGEVLEAYCEGLTERGFTFSRRAAKSGVVRILPNGEAPHVRLLGMLRPRRLMKKSRLTWEGKAHWGRNTERAVILNIEDLGDGPVVAVQTTTKTLIAEGFLTHNSHLCEIALRAGSPLPYRWSDLEEWSDALDPIRDPIPIGALRVFVDPADPRIGRGADEERQAAREGFRRRLTETTGVVATSESWEGASLVITALKPQVPKSVEQAISMLLKTWEIGGEEIEDKMRLKEIARQLSVGFYYKWMWPNDRPDREWLEARAAWHKVVRGILLRSRAGLDSPLLVARAVGSGQIDDAEARSAWAGWCSVRDRYNPTPPVEPIWINDFTIKATNEWAVKQLGHKGGPAILWYSHEAVGDALGDQGYPVYGSGADAGEADPDRERVIVCSIRAQGTGKNLQRYAKSLVVEPPASGKTWEQLLGRMHRPGQQSDEVNYEMFVHTPELEEAPLRAIEDALYVQQTQGQRQKLLVARRVNW